jgi:hypothetical protein
MPKPKRYTLTNDEFLYVSERDSFIVLNDTLIKRYITAKVLKRLNINPAGKLIKFIDNKQAITVEDDLNAKLSPASEDTKTPGSTPPPEPK